MFVSLGLLILFLFFFFIFLDFLGFGSDFVRQGLRNLNATGNCLIINHNLIMHLKAITNSSTKGII